MLYRALRIGTFAFPVWVLLASLLALWRPEVFTWFSGDLITVGLGLIMLGMGLTLEVDDFRRVLRRPAPIGLGVVLQYLVMPLMGWTVAWALDLPREFAVGLILVSCCPGGVASNVISYLALADVPLSVSMTAVSTSLSVLMTPAMTSMLASSRIDVPAAGLLLSTVQVVIFPLAAGLFLRRYARGVARVLLPYGPFTSVVLITLIVASIIGSSRAIILESGDLLIVAVFALHAGGFFFGYALHPARFAPGRDGAHGLDRSRHAELRARGSPCRPELHEPAGCGAERHFEPLPFAHRQCAGGDLACDRRAPPLRRPEDGVGHGITIPVAFSD